MASHMAANRHVLWRRFSTETNLLYVLFQQGDDLPNLEISGIRMKSAVPSVEAVLRASIRELSPLAGVCLDTCGGLGYTAVAMATAPRVTRVHCFEVDANVIEAARNNRASRFLFEDPKIVLRHADVFEALVDFPDASFDRVFHDPPRVSLSGDLYSRAFYDRLFRVMKPGGKLFHYTGSPGEKSGKRVRQGVMRRLADAGFVRVRDVPEAQGVSAMRGSASGPENGAAY